MAFVEFADGDSKPRFKPTHVSDLPHDIIEEISCCLNPRLLRKDYRSLAGKMGMTHRQVKNIDSKQNPTEELINLWVTGPGSKTVTDLMGKLKEIERHDAIRILQEHEFTVIERPTSISSAGSLTKEPIENDSFSDTNSRILEHSYHNSHYHPPPSSYPPSSYPPSSYPSSSYPSYTASNPSTTSTLLAEDPDTDEETNMSIVSGSISNRTSSSLDGYLDGTSNPRSRASTNDHLEYNNRYSGHHSMTNDYQHQHHYRPHSPPPNMQNMTTGEFLRDFPRDFAPIPPPSILPPPPSSQNRPTTNDDFYEDILAEKLRNQQEHQQRHQGCEVNDENCHPNYQFRLREGSDASTSTASSRMDAGIQTEKVSPTMGDLPPQNFATTPGPELNCKPPLVASDKIALLIGNTNYKHLEEPLVFPHRDVYALGHALNELGFKVLTLVDLTLREMRTIMLAYCQLLGPGVFAVFYFAGHGFEENGKNYLMPIDATSTKGDEFIQAQEILTEMRLANTALNLFIIDACRVKGINVSSTRGTLQKTGFGNTIMAYSCSSSMPAFEAHDLSHGIYMTHLLPRIKEDKRIEHILMEVNEAVHGNPLVVQRPVFESDAIGDCRLTCKIDAQANYEHWSQRFDKWFEATQPPEGQTISREEEKLRLRLEYKSMFSNMLQINVSISNQNDAPFFLRDVKLRNTSHLEIHENRLLPEGFLPPCSGFKDVVSFRIRDLQKVTYELLLVLEITASLKNEPCNVEVKLNADFPLISSFIQEFLSWITADKRATGGMKNTWV
ncbi:uncharacterized protein [Clytia hemisphaerica]|uniref:Uncharacterized protein n=1 Tax=Clytia hemisphaerica TaxID=252671 RepID=A0A7M5WYD0_9CNID